MTWGASFGHGYETRQCRREAGQLTFRNVEFLGFGILGKSYAGGPGFAFFFLNISGSSCSSAINREMFAIENDKETWYTYIGGRQG